MRQLIKSPFWGYTIFWSWNLIFLLFFTLGFTPVILASLLQAAREGWVHASFLAFGGLMVLIPIASVVLGLTVLLKHPNRLLVLFYGVEGPLLLVLCVRFFVVGEATPAVTAIMVAAFIGLATLLWQVLNVRGGDSRGALVTALRVVGLTALLLAGVYAAVWLAFYSLPLVAQMINALVLAVRSVPDMVRWSRPESLIYLPFSLLGFVLLMYSGTLLVVAPLVTPAIYATYWWRNVRAFWERFSRALAIALPAATVTACISAFALTNQQPQHRAFTLLEQPPASLAEAAALLDQQEEIRAGLLNAYLAPYRYMGAAGEIFHVRDMYRYSLGLSAEQTEAVMHWYETVAQPSLYRPVYTYPPNETQPWLSQAFVNESKRASELYEQFFDQPINRAERETIVQAVRSTWRIDRATQAWQAVDDREVLVMRQELTVTEHGDWADVELYETYQNLMPQQEEVVYYFSLPESAVLTGVWLGNSPDREQRYAFRVAPRGAAQAVYRREVQVRQDPALLEQIGPRQYRLRVFPIEPKRMVWDDVTRRSRIEDGAQMHLWLTWRVMAGDAGWPMPRLADKRNAFWDSSTVRLVNGAPMQVTGDAWLPEVVPDRSVPKRTAHRVAFADGTVVVARPSEHSNISLPDRFRLAVVLDRSRSMAEHAAAVRAALAQLEATFGDTDVYLTAAPNRGESPSVGSLASLDESALFYFGGQNPAELLAQFDRLRAGKRYDAVIVLTDGTAFAKHESATRAPKFDAPVWMVHLDGDLTMGYDDATLEAIQSSGGGVAESVDEALRRMAAQADQATGRADVLDGYVWIVAPAAQLPPNGEVQHAADDPFAALAARQWVMREMRDKRDRLGDVRVLDQLHKIATEQAIVTPYSSMIVLVNARQEQRLAELSQGADRFQREQENIGETQPVVTGVPEPHEWLLIGLVALMLASYVLRRRRQPALQ
jgi:putative PEP-CTERM system integral membrane protein